jgi:hypothetical protein
VVSKNHQRDLFGRLENKSFFLSLDFEADERQPHDNPEINSVHPRKLRANLRFSTLSKKPLKLVIFNDKIQGFCPLLR